MYACVYVYSRFMHDMLHVCVYACCMYLCNICLHMCRKPRLASALVVALFSRRKPRGICPPCAASVGSSCGYPAGRNRVESPPLLASSGGPIRQEKTAWNFTLPVAALSGRRKPHGMCAPPVLLALAPVASYLAREYRACPRTASVGSSDGTDLAEENSVESVLLVLLASAPVAAI